VPLCSGTGKLKSCDATAFFIGLGAICPGVSSLRRCQVK